MIRIKIICCGPIAPKKIVVHHNFDFAAKLNIILTLKVGFVLLTKNYSMRNVYICQEWKSKKVVDNG